MDEEIRENYLTRREAIDVIYNIINSNIVKEDLENELTEIANIIEYELKGEHAWGIPYKAREGLDTVYDDTTLTEEKIQELDNKHIKCRYIPSELEKQELIDYYKEICGINDESSYTDKRQFEKDFMYMYGISYDS